MSLLFTACGAQKDFLHNSDTYQVKQEQDLAATSLVTLSFERVSLFKTISLTDTTALRCQQHAADYAAASGIPLETSTLTIDADAKGKHCARRNEARQCQTTQYVYTVNCHFKTVAK